VGPCHHDMARPQVVDGGDGLQIWRVAVNILNKQPQITDKGWSSSLGNGQRIKNLVLQVQVAGSCKHTNKPLGFIKTELLDQLNDYQLMKNSIPCSLL